MHRSKKKFLRNGRGPQWLSATRAESAIRRPRRSQTGLEQWIAEGNALGYPERLARGLQSGPRPTRSHRAVSPVGEYPAG